MRRSLVVMALLLAMGLVGCGSSGAMQSYKTLAASGAAVDSLGEQALKVNAIFKQKCDVEKSLPAKTCNAYIDFGEKFKTVYPGTVALWKSSRKVSDTAIQGKVDDIVASLTSELVTFGTTVGYDVVANLKK